MVSEIEITCICAELGFRFNAQYRIVFLGGLTGRLDQTAHTIHALHKLRHVRPETWVVSDQNVACLLDAVRNQVDFILKSGS